MAENTFTYITRPSAAANTTPAPTKPPGAARSRDLRPPLP